MYVACILLVSSTKHQWSEATLDCHGWSDLQTGIEPLIEDQEISLPDSNPKDAEKGYFYPLLPAAGRRPPYPDTRFVNSIYHRLEVAKFLKKKLEVDAIHKYRIVSDGPPLDTTSQFPDDWLFEYGRKVLGSEHTSEDNLFVDVTKRDIVLHKNSDFYYGPLHMICFECSPPAMFRRFPTEPYELKWYDLVLDNPRRKRREEDNPFFCNNCEDHLAKGK